MTVTEHETRVAAPALEIPGKYVSLTTYRRDGSPVATPLWFVEEDGRLYVLTAADSYKAKRLRRNPACRVAPCNARGVAKGDAIPARAEFLPRFEHARVDRLMAKKYRVDRVLILPLDRLVMRLRGKPVAAVNDAHLVIKAT